jgi:hypothetical protein
MGIAQPHQMKLMTKLSFLNEVETELLSGGRGLRIRDSFNGSFNDTFTQTATLNQTSNQDARAFLGSAGNLAIQFAGISNFIN